VWDVADVGAGVGAGAKGVGCCGCRCRCLWHHFGCYTCTVNVHSQARTIKSYYRFHDPFPRRCNINILPIIYRLLPLGGVAVELVVCRSMAGIDVRILGPPGVDLVEQLHPHVR
jgi:hypothetical protein